MPFIYRQVSHPFFSPLYLPRSRLLPGLRLWLWSSWSRDPASVRVFPIPMARNATPLKIFLLRVQPISFPVCFGVCQWVDLSVLRHSMFSQEDTHAGQLSLQVSGWH